MKSENIILSEEAQSAITALQHVNGTYHYYADALGRLSNLVLYQSDEIGMSSTEALSTLRALADLRADLAAIAGPASADGAKDADPAEVAERVGEAFDGFDVKPDDK